MLHAWRLAFQRDHKAFSTWVFPFMKRTYVYTWASESRWDAGIRDSTYDCKFVNASDTALARYPPSIVKPNVSHILALFTRCNCSANFYQYLERCGGKRAGSLVFVVLCGTIDFCETSVGPSPLVRIILFQGGDASLGRKKLPPSCVIVLSLDRTLTEARLEFPKK